VVLVADVEGVGDAIVVTVTVIVLSELLAESPVELAVVELVVREVVVDELSPPSQLFASTELVASFPVMPP